MFRLFIVRSAPACRHVYSFHKNIVIGLLKTGNPQKGDLIVYHKSNRAIQYFIATVQFNSPLSPTYYSNIYWSLVRAKICVLEG